MGRIGNLIKGAAKGLGLKFVQSDFSDMHIVKVFGGQDLANQANQEFQSLGSFLTAPETISWVNVCCTKIGNNFGAAKGKVFDSNNAEVKDKDLSFLLRRANRFATMRQFRALMIWQVLLCGSAYIYKAQTNLYAKTKGIPNELFLLNPAITEPVIENGFPVKYKLDTGVKRSFFELDEIIHVKLPNPRSPYHGLGKIQANPALYRSENSAQLYNLNFFLQGGVPPFALIAQGDPSADDREEVKENYNQKFAGFKNAHKIAVFSGAMDIKEIAISQKDMEFIEQRKFNITEILGIFGVPPAKAGILENANYSNSEEQDATYWEDTIDPLLRMFDEDLTWGLIKKHFNPDWEYISNNVIKEDDKRYSEIAERLVNAGLISPNEGRTEYLDMKRVEGDPAMDKRYKQINYVPIGDLGYTEPPPDNDDDPEDKQISIDRKEGEDLTKDEFKPRATRFQLSILRLSRNARKRLGKTIKKEVQAVFDEQAKEIRVAFEESFGAKMSEDEREIKAPNRKPTGPEVEEFLEFVKGKVFGFTADNKLKDAVKKGHTSVMAAAIDELNEVMGTDVDSSTTNPKVTAGIGRLGRKITRVNATTRNAIENAVKRGVDAGDSIESLAKRITRVFRQAKGYRATMIARTESAAAYDQGSVLSYEDAGVKFVNVIGCEDNFTDCNAYHVPIEEAGDLVFHPNHTGAIVPEL